MEYLKFFDIEDNYLAYRDNKNKYVKPNVSFVYDNKEVYYNYTPAPQVTYDYVDLGLPSGTKWATMNVGASKPSDAGLYFQWGDTQGYTADQVGTGDGKKKFSSDWSDYKWGTYPNFSKYATTGATLDMEDDTANANMGGNWHMPTNDQINELLYNTTTGETFVDGMDGMLFTSKKDTSKSIFIPEREFYYDGGISNIQGRGGIWSSNLDSDYVYYGSFLELDFYRYNFVLSRETRNLGLNVRGVIG